MHDSGNGEKCNLSFQVKEPFPTFLTELYYSDISYKYIHVNTSVILLLLIIVLSIQAGFFMKTSAQCLSYTISISACMTTSSVFIGPNNTKVNNMPL